MLLYISPNLEKRESFCPIMRWLSFPCPGCGLTKSLCCISKGDILTSISYHPFGIVIECLAVCILVLSYFDYKRNKTYVNRLLNSNLIWKGFAFSFFVFYVSRVIYFFLSGDYWF